MKRSPFVRRPPRRRGRAVRPLVTPALPKGWAKLAREIRQRDGFTCRFCGGPAPNGAVDHLLPRRLLVGRETATKDNLATLCAHCHGEFKTGRIEPGLYRGDVLAFDRFLAICGISGPIPSQSLKARAYKRLTKAVCGSAM